MGQYVMKGLIIYIKLKGLPYNICLIVLRKIIKLKVLKDILFLMRIIY